MVGGTVCDAICVCPTSRSWNDLKIVKCLSLQEYMLEPLFEIQ